MSGSLPGAPGLLNAALGATGSLPLLQVADAFGINSETLLGQWGIYTQSAAASGTGILSAIQQATSTVNSFFSGQAGTPLFTVDSVVSFSYSNDDNISKYPVEGGGFASYNKVQTPASIKMTVALSGTFTFASLLSAGVALLSGSISGAYNSLTGTSARTALISALRDAQNSTALLNVVTPEYTYNNFNIVHHDYDRSAEKGATLLQVEIHLEEVRLVATQSYSNTQSPSGANAAANGPTQPSVPSAAQTTSVQLAPPS
jgi:hypothetical protein